MATPRQKVLVGIFLSVCSVLIVGTLLVLSGVRHERTVPFFIEFDETVSGLFRGAEVRYRGVPVGRVTDITVTRRNRVRVEVAIRPSGVGLRQGVTAQLNLLGITGQMYINLEGGEPEGELVPPRALIPAAPSLFANLFAELPTLLASMTSILLRLDNVLGEEGEAVAILREVYRLATGLNAGVNAVSSRTLTLLERVEALAEQEVRDLVMELVATTRVARRVLERNEPALQTAVSSGARSLQRLENHLVALDLQGTNAKVQRTLQHITQLTEQFGRTSEEINLALQQFRGDASNVEFHIRQVVRTWRETLQSAQQLFEYLEQDPSALLTGKRAPAGTTDGQRRR